MFGVEYQALCETPSPIKSSSGGDFLDSGRRSGQTKSTCHSLKRPASG